MRYNVSYHSSGDACIVLRLPPSKNRNVLFLELQHNANGTRNQDAFRLQYYNYVIL
ncbi:MAG: hypothetical protein ACMUHX_03000 [bacterium]